MANTPYNRLHQAILAYHAVGDQAEPDTIFNLFRHNPTLLVPVEEHKGTVTFKKLPGPMGTFSLPAFTVADELNKKPYDAAVTMHAMDLANAVLNDPKCQSLVLDAWGKPLRLDRKALQVLISYKPRPHVHLVEGQAWKIPCDVVAAESDTKLSCGVALKLKAGKDLEKALGRIHKCPEGQVRRTEPYGLDSTQAIVHAAVPAYKEKERDWRLLSNAVKASLDSAFENGDLTMALPVFGQTFPEAEAAKTVWNTIVAWLDAHPMAGLDLYLACTPVQKAVIQDLVK